MKFGTAKQFDPLTLLTVRPKNFVIEKKSYMAEVTVLKNRQFDGSS